MKYKYLYLIFLVIAFPTIACRPSGFKIGGGGTIHIPPDHIQLGEPTSLILELRVWGEGNSDISKRWSEVNCVYKISDSNIYASIAMSIIESDTHKIVYSCMIPPQFKKGHKIEYYFETRFDGKYSRREGAVIPIY
jgi:hypothetical protein